MNLRPPLTHLDFNELFRFYDRKLVQIGVQILHNLALITQPTLSYLELSFNDNLWEVEAAFNSLLSVL